MPATKRGKIPGHFLKAIMPNMVDIIISSGNDRMMGRVEPRGGWEVDEVEGKLGG
jgi:hypothetical protein